MSSHQDQPRSDRPATQVMLLLAAGKAEAAHRLLIDSYTHRLYRLFMRNSLNQWAEEMTADTFLNFLKVANPSEVAGHAEPRLFSIAKNVLIDYARKANAQFRGGGSRNEEGPAEVLLEDEELLESLAADSKSVQDPWWYLELQDCVEKAMAFFRKERPTYAETLWLVFLGYDTKEIAVFYGADLSRANSEDRKRLLGNARQRMHHARVEARSYFQHCKD